MYNLYMQKRITKQIHKSSVLRSCLVTDWLWSNDTLFAKLKLHKLFMQLFINLDILISRLIEKKITNDI